MGPHLSWPSLTRFFPKPLPGNRCLPYPGSEAKQVVQMMGPSPCVTCVARGKLPIRRGAPSAPVCPPPLPCPIFICLSAPHPPPTSPSQNSHWARTQTGWVVQWQGKTHGGFHATEKEAKDRLRAAMALEVGKPLPLKAKFRKRGSPEAKAPWGISFHRGSQRWVGNQIA